MASFPVSTPQLSYALEWRVGMRLQPGPSLDDIIKHIIKLVKTSPTVNRTSPVAASECTKSGLIVGFLLLKLSTERLQGILLLL